MRIIDADELNKFPIRLNHYDKEHGSEKYVFGVEAVLEYAEYLPTIDPEDLRPKGEWIEIQETVWHLYEQRTMTFYKCSHCEQKENKKSDYCPKCGAKMEVKSNG